MGLTGELVRSVFSRSQSVSIHGSNVRNYGADKGRWSSVRSYLCGDEFNSVLAENDSASVQSSEVTVSQPTPEDLTSKVETEIEEKEEQKSEEKQNSLSKHLREEDAATFIQAAFRRFLAHRRNGNIERVHRKESAESPSGESVGTSIEVQTGNSVEALTVRAERMAVQHRLQAKARSQVSKLKEDWDDSTVSTTISKLRIQNRLEATTRRERALAYAFSQQLRICSRKKSRCETAEHNIGWSWLERWMATRLPENSLVEYHMSNRYETSTSDQRSMIMKKFDAEGEEKESCGSNEVSVGNDNLTVTSPSTKNGAKHSKNRLKATRSVSRRKTVPSYLHPSQLTKVTKNDCSKEFDKDRKHKQANAAKK